MNQNLNYLFVYYTFAPAESSLNSLPCQCVSVSTHFEMTRAFAILSFFLFVSCRQGLNKTANKNTVKENAEIKLIPFELTVEDADHSMSNTLIYELTEKNLTIISRSDFNIVGIRKGENTDTVFKTDLKPNAVLQKLSNINLDSLQEGYFNHCIIDGSQITVRLKNANNIKEIHLSNYYQSDIGLIIKLVNSLTPKDHKIWYDKKELLKEMRRCK